MVGHPPFDHSLLNINPFVYKYIHHLFIYIHSFILYFFMCPEGDLHQRQEVLVYYYLYGMLRQVDEIKEYRFDGLVMLSCRK